MLLLPLQPSVKIHRCPDALEKITLLERHTL